MTAINWKEEVQKREAEILAETQRFLQIKSVLTSAEKQEEPFGPGIAQALDFLLNKGKNDGFSVKNVDGYAGHIEAGEGKDLLGILCHVDVVPEGDGWSVDPYGGEIKDGKIFARGAIDDKGPTMAAYYAMKIVKDLGLPLSKRVRMIIGTDEESDWRCVDHYFNHEEMPTMGFAPDADFPIIFAEKGITDVEIRQQPLEGTKGSVQLTSFVSGRRHNMVPDLATAVLEFHSETDIKNKYDQFLKDQSLKGSITEKSGVYTLTLEGVSAHGSVPDKGKNAGLMLLRFLHTLELDEQANQFVGYANAYLVQDVLGEKMGLNRKDEVTGDLTINVGIMSYNQEEAGHFGLNIRYPVSAHIDDIIDTIKEKSESYQMTIKHFTDSKPHHVDQKHELIQTLQKVYQEQTNEEPTLISIGGGTYARALEAGVAFGPLFPGREEVAHEKDEYMVIEDLLRATAIYAQAIYELAK
ncbi:dipeptidase PepV [Priestia megaterium]|uniref:dipeptidase PepV n=1 Tax=Priestia megaterium TaxID=1404 RepID=UPI002E1CC045|nr:dipeptidase PepV [Priestia megaterium]MED3944608.1 dipeptidase PepV [Priestia megaterium]